MSEGNWVKAKHGEIVEGDVVRVTSKDGPQTTITEGAVTSVTTQRDGSRVWSIEDYENFYSHEFVPDEDDGEFSTLERFVPPFAWPTKLGAVVTGVADEGDTIKAVLVYEPVDSEEDHLWYTVEWGVVNVADIEGLVDLTVVSEGVTVKA